MEMLIGAGSDVNVLNHKRHSPLQIAVAKPSKRCVTALVKHHSCNVNLQVLLLENFFIVIGTTSRSTEVLAAQGSLGCMACTSHPRNDLLRDRWDVKPRTRCLEPRKVFICELK